MIKLSPARLAQSVEHQTFNLRVMGSSPISGGTSTFFFLAQSSLLALLHYFILAVKTFFMRSINTFFLAQSSLLAQGIIAAGFRRT